MKKRNPIARANWLINKPKIIKSKKGKGSFKRDNHKPLEFERKNLE